MDYPPVPGVKIIKLNSSNIDDPEDPDLKWKLEMTFSPPEFMQVTFVLMHGGSEVLVVQGVDREALDRFLEIESQFKLHPRLIRMTITDPEGKEEVFTRESLRS